MYLKLYNLARWASFESSTRLPTTQTKSNFSWIFIEQEVLYEQDLKFPCIKWVCYFVIKCVCNSKTTSLVNNFFCNYSLLDDARSMILSEPMSGPLVNGLQTTDYSMSSTAKWLLGHVNLPSFNGLSCSKDKVNIDTLTFGCAKELSSWYLMAVGILAGGGSFSGADASTVPTPIVTGSYCSSVGSAD